MNLYFQIYTIAFLLLASLTSSAKPVEPNDLVKFLAGKWNNVSFEISDGKPVKKEEYSEAMVVKDADTLTITAYGFKDGKDLTKDMHLEVRGNEVTMSQGSFNAIGKREDGVLSHWLLSSFAA